MSRGMKIDVVNLPEVQDALRQVGSRADQVIDGAVQAGALLVQNAATGRLRTGYLLLSGTLRRSIQSRRERSTRGGVSYTVGPRGVPYATIHEFGGTIRPRGEFLVFQVGGELIFARQVTIPARPYMRPAYDETSGQIPREIGRVIGQAVGG